MALSKIQDIGNQVIPNLGRRNLIINGGMQVAQRGTSVSSLTAAGYKEGPDRFRRSMNQAGGLAVTRERLSNDAPEGFTYSLKETVSVVSNEASTSWAWRMIDYRIEGQDLQHLKFGTSNAKSVVFTFYVKSNKTGTASVVLYSYDASGNSRTNTRRYTINAANTWEKKTLTFNGDTATAIRNSSDIGFNIVMHVGSGSARTVQDNTNWGVNEANSAWYQCNLDVNNVNDFVMFAGLQLEIDTDSDFEHRSFAEELSLCQRYYYRINSIGSSDERNTGFSRSTTTCWVSYPFPVEMNHEPVLETSGTASHYAINIKSATTTCNSVPTNNSSGKEAMMVGWYVPTNTLTTGEANGLRFTNSNAFLAFESEI